MVINGQIKVLPKPYHIYFRSAMVIGQELLLRGLGEASARADEIPYSLENVSIIVMGLTDNIYKNYTVGIVRTSPLGVLNIGRYYLNAFVPKPI